jgi:hypothetical protein
LAGISIFIAIRPRRPLIPIDGRFVSVGKRHWPAAPDTAIAPKGRNPVPLTAISVSVLLTATSVAVPLTAISVSVRLTATSVAVPLTAISVSGPLTAISVSVRLTATSVYLRTEAARAVCIMTRTSWRWTEITLGIAALCSLLAF